MHDGMYTYPGPEEYLGGAAVILPSLKDNRELDGTTPRGLVVRREEEPWIAIRSDGWVLTRHGSVHIREMWQKGVDEVTIAKEIQSLAKWGEPTSQLRRRMRFKLGQRDDGEGRDNMSALSRDASDLLWVLPSLTCGSSRERVSFPVVRGF